MLVQKTLSKIGHTLRGLLGLATDEPLPPRIETTLRGLTPTHRPEEKATSHDGKGDAANRS
jgi:hypothetical protein